MRKMAMVMVVILSLGLISFQTKAKKPEVRPEFNEQDAIVLGTSMLINGLIGGWGAHLNKSPNANIWHDQNFWHGFSQGAIGGSFIYGGMKTMTLQNEWDYAILTGKQISDFGTSLTYSAALGENWLENPRYITDFGPIVFNWDKKSGFKPDVTIMTWSAVSTLYAFTEGNLNIETSLKTGMLIFDGQGNSAGRYKEDHRDGVHMCNIAIIPPEDHPLDNTPAWNYNVTMAHEAIHSREYFLWTALDPTMDYYLKVGPARTSKLGYEHHPFRFGADLGGLMWSGVGQLHYLTGMAPYGDIVSEYANFHLFNFADF